ncbi:hypothetical protein NED98_05720 [Sphingomonas sp. MMSM20]|uniref:hypothetical protein n=1 Tax=Sphingomonas lycopersici TaxID=2951807 RepID=UPI00223842DD|nr:hypothetical protein [Sphingomonas lycopersici]MCW6529738.1 hypothetical protein [Sphingomonas lycopersici]
MAATLSAPRGMFGAPMLSDMRQPPFVPLSFSQQLLGAQSPDPMSAPPVPPQSALLPSPQDTGTQPDEGPRSGMPSTAQRPIFGAEMLRGPNVDQMTAAPDSLTTPKLQPGMFGASFDVNKIPIRKPSFFQSGGLGEKILGGIGEFALRYSASQGDPYAMAVINSRLARQRDKLEWQRDQMKLMQQHQWHLDDRDFEANKPVIRNTSNEIVRVDPRTGSAQMLYKGSLPAEDYAQGLGFEAGSPEYNSAMQDYVLRANGPTAFQNNTDLEGVKQDNRVSLENTRQGNRVSLEGVRQQNRIGLRGVPTYADTHPRPGAGGNPTLGGVVAPILAKIRDGKPLSPSEQLAWNSYKSGRSHRGGLSMPNNPPSMVPGTPQLPVTVATPEQARMLPKGTYFKTPDGQVKVR